MCDFCHTIGDSVTKNLAEAVRSRMVVGMMGWNVHEQGWWRKGPLTPEEDKLLIEYVSLHGEGRWSSVAKSAGMYLILY